MDDTVVKGTVKGTLERKLKTKYKENVFLEIQSCLDYTALYTVGLCDRWKSR